MKKASKTLQPPYNPTSASWYVKPTEKGTWYFSGRRKKRIPERMARELRRSGMTRAVGSEEVLGNGGRRRRAR